MNKICRLCLSISWNMVNKLGNKTKLMDYLSYLNIEIPIIKSLPEYICSDCWKILEKCVTFRKSIIENQNRLLELSNNKKNLNIFYQHLIQNVLEDTKSDTEMDIEDNNISDMNDSKPIFLSNIINNKCLNQQETKHNVESNCADKSCTENNLMTKDTNTLVDVKQNSCKVHKQNKEIQSEVSQYVFNKKYEIEMCAEIIENISNDNDENLAQNGTESNDNDLSNNEIEIKIQSYKCLMCFVTLATTKSLTEHYEIVHAANGEKEQVKCNEIYNNQSDDKSEKITKKLEGLYICKICGRTFTNAPAIVRHGVTHSDSSHHCSRGCGYSTVYKGALRDHERRHEKDYKYKCGTCGAGYFVKTWYEQHQNQHNNIKPYVCDLCGMAFHFERYLKSHMSSVHPAQSKGLKRYVCPHCYLPFEHRHLFNTHIETHKGKKLYLCDVCGQQCSTREILKDHTIKHTGVRPFKCKLCNKSFFKNKQLKAHAQVHAGVKHLCVTCGHYFAQRSTLRRHIKKTHPEIKLDSKEPIKDD